MGDTELATKPSKGGTWGWRVGVATGTSYADTAYHDDKAEPREATEHFTQRVTMVSLLAGAEAPFGTGAQVLVPYSRIEATSDTPANNTADDGLGDIELRLRQDLTRPFGVRNPLIPRLSVSLGAVLPTGQYIGIKQRTTSGVVDNTYLSLGRGTYWLLADAELAGRIGERFGWSAGVTSRSAAAATDTDDGFEWGREVRASAGVSASAFAGKATLAANVEHQWREVSFWRDFLDERKEWPNTGGRSLDLAPALRGQWTDSFATTLSARLPLWRAVEGVQAVPSYGVFLTVAYSGTLARAAATRDLGDAAKPGDPPPPAVADKLAPNRTTVVAYGASWQAPCQTLPADLDKLRASRPDVTFATVDASDWSSAQMTENLPGVSSLPVIDVYGPDRRLKVRLPGSEAAQVIDYLPAAASATTTP